MEKEIIRVVQKTGIRHAGRFFMVSPELFGVTGRLDLESLKFYPVSNPKQIGYDVVELNTPS